MGWEAGAGLVLLTPVPLDLFCGTAGSCSLYTELGRSHCIALLPGWGAQSGKRRHHSHPL